MTMRWGVAGSYPALYEELMVAGFFRVFAEDLVSRMAPQPGDRLLDVATGTGIVVRVAYEHEPAIGAAAGLDMTAAMLDVARAAAAELPAEWHEGDALALPFGAASFDLVTCQQGLQFFPDRAAALAEMRRVLVPGGRVAVSCWAGLEAQAAFGALAGVLREHEPDIAPVAGAPFALGDDDELRELLVAAGFEDVAVARVELPSSFASPEAFFRAMSEGSPLAFALAEVPAERVAALRDAVLTSLAPHVRADGLHDPMVTHVALGRTPATAA